MRRILMAAIVLVLCIPLALPVQASDPGQENEIVTYADISLSEYLDFYFVKHPISFRGKVGDKTSFVVAVNRTDVTFQWQYRSSSLGSWANTTLAGYNTSTFSPLATAARDGFQYRCIVTDSTGRSIASSAAQLTIVSDSSEDIPSTAIFMVTHIFSNLIYWFETVLAESGFSGLYLGVIFLFLLGKYLLQPLFGSAGSDKARKKVE